MRRLWPKGLAALGLALAASTPALAGLPEMCLTCGGNPHPKHATSKAKTSGTQPVVYADPTHIPASAPAPGMPTRIPVGHVCDNCAAHLQPPGSAPVAVMAGDLPMVVSGPGGSTPGYAIVGGVPTEMMAGNGSAPGYAVVGGAIPGAEPAPIGVVQAGYRSPTAALPGARPATYGQPAAAIPPAPTPSGPPQRRGPRILPHMLFLSGRSAGENWYEMRQGRRRDTHAAIAYGNPDSKVTELPASMVYDGKH